MIYHIILLACLCFSYFIEKYSMSIATSVMPLAEQKQRGNRMEKCLLIALVLYMIFLCGMRSYKGSQYVGTDSNNYYHSYLLLENWRFHDFFAEDVTDRGYYFFAWLIRSMGWEFTVVITIAAIIFMIPVTILIYKYSKNRFMSIFVFMAMGLYFFGFTAIRQTMAMGICICAYLFSDKVSGVKGLLGFCAIVWFASTFHKSAIVFFPAYFLQKMPFKTSISLILLGVAAVSMLFKNQFANFLVQIASEASENYERYEEVTVNGSAGILLYLFVLMTVVLRLLVAEGKLDIAKNDNMVYFLQFMLILFPAVQTGGAIMRIYFYYYIFIVAYLPNILESMGDVKTKRLAYCLLTFFLLYLYLSSNLERSRLLPYQFFWKS